MERATIRHSRSPGPVIVCASSTSGMSGEVRGDRVVPAPWRISSVTNAVTGKPSAAGSMSGPQPIDHAAGDELVQPGLHGAAGDPEPARRLEHADPRLGGEQADQLGVELVELHGSSWSDCPA